MVILYTVKSWSLDKNNVTELQEIINVLENSSPETVDQFVNALEGGIINADDKFGDKNFKEIIDKLTPIKEYVIPTLKDIQQSIGTVNQKDIQIEKLK